ncbi:hypothetical protein TSUD_186560 [Trifolium subterraneum]|uniref:Uncharacterized protein n=1 Tax=Trifolium subterraneum TaxID=3900 RepID=A0A2Z6PMA1_TRISU|nr:hypothetical protein TSUD_186560 [Trifolium subterraneum]
MQRKCKLEKKDNFILKINTKMVPPNKVSYVSSDCHNTHYVLPTWIPPKFPPSEPPDRVVHCCHQETSTVPLARYEEVEPHR